MGRVLCGLLFCDGDLGNTNEYFFLLLLYSILCREKSLIHLVVAYAVLGLGAGNNDICRKRDGTTYNPCHRFLS